MLERGWKTGRLREALASGGLRSLGRGQRSLLCTLHLGCPRDLALPHHPHVSLPSTSHAGPAPYLPLYKLSRGEEWPLRTLQSTLTAPPTQGHFVPMATGTWTGGAMGSCVYSVFKCCWSPLLACGRHQVQHVNCGADIQTPLLLLLCKQFAAQVTLFYNLHGAWCKGIDLLLMPQAFV